MIIHNCSDINRISSGQKPILFMFPFAGGNTYSYRGLIESLEVKFDIVCVELPGRNHLMQYDLLDNVPALTDFLFEKWIKPVLFNRPYYFYGHSMGGIMSYSLVKKIVSKNMVLPLHMYVSGCIAPSVERKNKIHDFSSVAFWQELERKGGIPEIILQNHEFREFIEPILRSDFKAIENYSYQKSIAYNIPMTIMYGTEEGIEQASLQKWDEETTQKVKYMEFPGTHFFIYKHKAQIVEYIKETV